jgi:F-box-like
VSFDTLPDDVLLDIFDFYRIDSTHCPWIWVSLVHVCRRWRQIIYASQRRLDLQFLCRPRTRVRELLDFLPPAMPIMVCNCCSSQSQQCPTLSYEDGGQVITAIEQRDRVQWIHLQDISSTLLEKMVKMMQETYPTLEHLRLWADDEIAPVLPEEFLGGSAPCVETFWLRGIPFPEVPKLLLTMNDLVHLRLEKIPDSGYIPPEAMLTALSTCAKLETLIIEFKPGDPNPDLTSQEITSIARAFLPALTFFCFSGNGRYFDNFVPRIESPSLGLNDYIRHDTVDSDVFYEVYLTSSGISFRFLSQLTNPVPVED